MGFCGHHLQLIFLNRLRVLLEEKIPCVKKKDLLCALPNFFYPTSPSGKTTDLARLPSGGAGLDLAVEIIAVEKGQGFRCFLGVEERPAHPEDPTTKRAIKNDFLFIRRTSGINIEILIPDLFSGNKNQ